MKTKIPFLVLSTIALVACGGGASKSQSSSQSSSEESSSQPTSSSSSNEQSSSQEEVLEPEEFAGEDAPEEAKITKNSTKGLLNGSQYVLFNTVEETKFGVEYHETASDYKVSFSNTPATIRVRGKNQGLLDGSFKETIYQFAYDTLTKKNYGYLLEATVITNYGSEFKVKDSYYVAKDDGIAVNRQVIVKKAAKEDIGFASVYSLVNSEGSADCDDFEYLIPAILYKNTENLNAAALANNLYVGQLYIKETRMGIPMSMMRSKSSGYYTSISHAEPKVSANGLVGGGSSGAVDDRIQYASLGFTFTKGVACDFCYPCHEGPTTYDCGAAWGRRYNSVAKANYHEYKMAVNTKKTDSFNDAVVESYKVAYEHIDATCRKISNEVSYLQNIEVFDKEYREFGTGTIKSAGVPWEIALDPAKVKREYSFQMGFVGQQTSVGAHLYRQGLTTKNSEMARKGKTIVNFWNSSAIQSTYFPVVWWDGANNSGGGTKRSYASYLRCMVDGMEGILDAYNYGVENGETNSTWLQTLNTFTNHLIAKQNEDGSFNRAYTQSGTVAIDPSDKCLQGESKLNTPVAIRFLAKMYKLTNNQAYKDAALKAAEFSYTNIYEALGKYVGGTPDNPNVVDKEAAIYAMYGFTYAYELTGLEKFKHAMEHAAVCSLTWAFVYDFACPADGSNQKINPFNEGGTIGFSIIATGHGAADSFASYMWYDLYRVYTLNHDPTFYKAAVLLEHATKLCTDYDGKYGYTYKALMPEASQVSEFSFKSVGTCLPWAEIANINPIIYLLEDKGVWQLEDIK